MRKEKKIISCHCMFLVSFSCEHISFVQVQKLKLLRQFSGGKPAVRNAQQAHKKCDMTLIELDMGQSSNASDRKIL